MTSTLHVKTTGQGPDMVMLHGWGMHAGVWQDISAALADEFRIHSVDLPGHGMSRDGHENGATLERWAERVAEAVIPLLSGPACWLGWSLGGMVAMQLAHLYPQQVKRLILVATSLRFCQADDWPEAVASDVLQGFATDLLQDHRATLQRFLALQVIGDAQSRQTLKALRQRLLEQPEPDTVALKAGLEILRSADLRSLAPQLSQPVMLIGGERDRLVSPAALDNVASLLPQCQFKVIPVAGHAPFISQPESFVNLVKAYCESID
jgi:pimeloyl-[acyl-carrier protein] methyl ester esterase